MKIEIGESLIYSFLRHEKECLITQTNWKPSSNWEIVPDVKERVNDEFNRINNHPDFLEIFKKSSLEQTIKQAEIDVLGIGKDNRIYAFEVAFHENGLQYGDKTATKDRVFKKLLRGLLTLKCYFPDKKHIIAFCSPKVNPATEERIKEYFGILKRDFQSDDIEFCYYSNEKFNAEIANKTLTKTKNEADSGELFIRAIKLLNLVNKSNKTVSNNSDSEIKIGKLVGAEIPSIIKFCEKNPEELKNLQGKDYSKTTFNINYPFFKKVAADSIKQERYWKDEYKINDLHYVVTSEWFKKSHPLFEEYIRQKIK